MPLVVGIGTGIPFNGLPNVLVSLMFLAEQAAQTSGVSIWYAPPNSYAPRITQGPFVNFNQTGGVPTDGQPVGWIKDRKVS